MSKDLKQLHQYVSDELSLRERAVRQLRRGREEIVQVPSSRRTLTPTLALTLALTLTLTLTLILTLTLTQERIDADVSRKALSEFQGDLERRTAVCKL